MNKIPRGKWYCHGCISKAPPPKKRAPRKSTPKEVKDQRDPKDIKESKDLKSPKDNEDLKKMQKDSKEKINISTATVNSTPSADETPRASTPQPIVCANAASTPLRSNNTANEDQAPPSR